MARRSRAAALLPTRTAKGAGRRICAKNRPLFSQQPNIGAAWKIRCHATAASTSSRPHKNLLAEEKSPYLLQHKNNPVHWFPYGRQAFAIAKQENKPLMISIGYATCHWCHVMERESFEDEEVAAVLNRDFVSVKVDREEMPDVDGIYMRAAQSLGMGGGWPLTVFVTPDQEPFFAGTYFPKPHFMALLSRVTQAWNGRERNELEEVGRKVRANLVGQSGLFDAKGGIPDESVLVAAYHNARESFDAHYGGFGGAPKFPPSTKMKLLLRIHRRTGDKSALHMTERTLQAMARGGLYDHLGGGFARYSTDARWLIPHFEKMLYDNAMITQALVACYQVTKNPFYASVTNETMRYVLDAMQNKQEGGFYSAEDADSEGEEGKFYVWKYHEIKSVLSPEEFEKFGAMYGVTEMGNFEHNSTHLSLQEGFDWADKNDPLVKSAARKLVAVRDRRIRPLRDEKQLTCMNGLMIESLASAVQVLGNSSDAARKDTDEWLEAAQRAASFVRARLYSPSRASDAGKSAFSGKLLRRYAGGEAKFCGTLDDYAYMISALISLYQCDHDPQWIDWALQLQRDQDSLFWDRDDQGGKGYFYTPLAENNDVPLLVRIKEFIDGATPNANGVSALNLLRLHSLTYDKEHLHKAEGIFRAASEVVERYPDAFVQLLLALDYYTDAATQVAVIKPGREDDSGAKKLVDAARSVYAPNMVLAVGAEGDRHDKTGLLQGKRTLQGSATAYVCEGTTCRAPTTEPAQLVQQLETKRSFSLQTAQRANL